MQKHDIFIDGRRLEDWLNDKRFDVISKVVNLLVESAIEAKADAGGLLHKLNDVIKATNANKVKEEVKNATTEKGS